jgi:UTP--glucose-1-phosphate uridylyltransferase
VIDTAVVPVAGRGTRLLPATRAVPKALLPLVNEPVIDIVLEELGAAGITRVVLVVGEHEELLRKHLGDRVEYVRQPEPLGLGDAVARGARVVDGPYVVALGDAVIQPFGIVPRLISALEGYDAAIAVQHVAAERASSYGIVDADYSPTGAPVRSIVEKPANPATTLAVAGRYVIGKELELVAGAGEVQLTDALAKLRCVAVGLDAERLDVGDPDGYAKAFLARYESRRR